MIRDGKQDAFIREFGVPVEKSSIQKRIRGGDQSRRFVELIQFGMEDVFVQHYIGNSIILGEARPNAENLFVTETYSIENYLVDSTMLKRIARELWHLEEHMLFKHPLKPAV